MIILLTVHDGMIQFQEEIRKIVSILAPDNEGSALWKIRKLDDMAKDRGQTLAQMALSWVYSKNGVTSVLVGASKKEQIVENLKMVENTSFTKEELDKIDEISL